MLCWAPYRPLSPREHNSPSFLSLGSGELTQKTPGAIRNLNQYRRLQHRTAASVLQPSTHLLLWIPSLNHPLTGSRPPLQPTCRRHRARGLQTSLHTHFSLIRVVTECRACPILSFLTATLYRSFQLSGQWLIPCRFMPSPSTLLRAHLFCSPPHLLEDVLRHQ